MAALEAARLPGSLPVGWTRATAHGQPLLLFYPALGSGRQARFDGESDAIARRFGEKAAVDLAAAKGPGGLRAAPRRGDWPLLLFVPGAGLGARDYRWLLAGLASRGMLVAALDPLGSPSASEERVATARDALLSLARALPTAPGLRRYGEVARVDFAGHSIGGAAAVAAQAGVKDARALDIDGDFLGVSRAPAKGPVLLISGLNPDEPASAEQRRSADWSVVANGKGRRVLMPALHHLGATDAALLPADRRDADLGPDPAAAHYRLTERAATFLLEGR